MTMRVALVTGCGKRDGMGQAIARTLAASGVAVVVSDQEAAGVLNRRQEALLSQGALLANESGLPRGAPQEGWRGVRDLVEEIISAGGVASHLLGDIGDPGDARRMVGETVAGTDGWTSS